MGYSQNSPAKKNGWETDNLKGKVKSYKEYNIGALVIYQERRFAVGDNDFGIGRFA